jgi:hypothetical protein
MDLAQNKKNIIALLERISGKKFSVSTFLSLHDPLVGLEEWKFHHERFTPIALTARVLDIDEMDLMDYLDALLDSDNEATVGDWLLDELKVFNKILTQNFSDKRYTALPFVITMLVDIAEKISKDQVYRVIGQLFPEETVSTIDQAINLQVQEEQISTDDDDSSVLVAFSVDRPHISDTGISRSDIKDNERCLKSSKGFDFSHLWEHYHPPVNYEHFNNFANDVRCLLVLRQEGKALIKDNHVYYLKHGKIQQKQKPKEKKRKKRPKRRRRKKP